MVTGDDEVADKPGFNSLKGGVRALFRRDSPTVADHRHVVMSRHQQLLRIDLNEPSPPTLLVASAQVDEMFQHQRKSDYVKGALKNHQVLIQAAKARAFRCWQILRARTSRFIGARQCSITPNLSESSIVGGCVDEHEL